MNPGVITKEPATVISRTGTRHIVGGFVALHKFRITAICGFGVRPEEQLADAVRDCELCLREARKAKRDIEKR